MPNSRRDPWMYRGHYVTRTASTWVGFTTGFGFLKADTKAGMRELIRRYAH